MVCFMVVAVVVADESEAKNVNSFTFMLCIKKLNYKGMTSLRPFLLCGYAFLDAPHPPPPPLPPLRTLMCCFNLF